jgi:glutathione peroxidase
MKKLNFGLITGLFFLTLVGNGCKKKKTEKKNISSKKTIDKTSPATVYGIEYNSIDGKKISFSQYKGKVILIVNTASKCRYTPQLKGLEKLYNKYKDKGFLVIGFPSNQFLWQEPGSNKEIQNFCQTNYGVNFPLSEKIKVNGSKKHPLYSYLTNKGAIFPGKISWNFQKFLINREGIVIARFSPKEKPQSQKIINLIEKELAKTK